MLPLFIHSSVLFIPSQLSEREFIFEYFLKRKCSSTIFFKSYISMGPDSLRPREMSVFMWLYAILIYKVLIYKVLLTEHIPFLGYRKIKQKYKSIFNLIKVESALDRAPKGHVPKAIWTNLRLLFSCLEAKRSSL